MKKSGFIIFLLSLFVPTAMLIAQVPSFTENFNNASHLDDYNTRVSGGYNRAGYTYAYSYNDSFWYNWGNIVYFSNYLYIVWADDRWDGEEHIFVAKLSAVDGSHQWTTNFQVDDLTGESYRPTITVYDRAHIYVAWCEYDDANGLWDLFAMRIDESSGAPVLSWASPLELGYPSSPDDPHWQGWNTWGTHDQNGNYFIHATWNWIGGGNRNNIASGDTGGALRWNRGNRPDAESGYFEVGSAVAFLNNYIVGVAHSWHWGNKDRGVFMAVLTNNSSGSDIINSRVDARGTVLSGLSRSYFDPAILKDPTTTAVYFAWCDNRSGTADIYVRRLTVPDLNPPTANWNNDIRANRDTAGAQISPALGYDYAHNRVYVVWRDRSSGKIELVRMKPDGTIFDTSDKVLISSSYARHPHITTDSNGNIYIAYLESSGGRYKIQVSKFSNDLSQIWGPTNAVKVIYKRISHAISDKLLFSPPAPSILQAKITNLVAITNGGTIEMYLSHNGGNDWYPATNNVPVTFSGKGWEFKYKIIFTGNGLQEPRIDTFKILALKYYTGDLAYSFYSNTGWSGVGTIESLGSSQSLSSNVIANGTNKAIYWVKLTNTGNTNADFYIYGVSGSGNWDVYYYDDGTDVTSLVTVWSGYLITNMGPGDSKTLKVEVIPKVTSFEGETFSVYVYSYVDRGIGVHDSVVFTTKAWEYRPDVLLKTSPSASPVGDNVYETGTPSLQTYFTSLNTYIAGHEERHTNYFIIQNDGVEPDQIEFYMYSSNYGGSPTNWNIYITNITAGLRLTTSYTTVTNGGVYSTNGWLAVVSKSTCSVNPGSSNLIMIVTYPEVWAITNERIYMNFIVKSIKTSPADDPIRIEHAKLSFKALKYQPDVIIAEDQNFTIATGENIYSWTNTSFTQAIMQKTVPDKEIIFYAKIYNDGESYDTINLHLDPVTNTNWTYYYEIWQAPSYIDITSKLTDSNGTNINLAPGVYALFRFRFTPNTNVPSGEWYNLALTAYSTNKPFVRDVAYIRPYNKKLRPDLLVATNTNIYLGSLFYTTNETALGTQTFFKKLEISEEEQFTYYFKAINRSPTDPDTLVIKGEGSDIFTNWSITYYNYTNGLDITSSITGASGYEVTLQTNEEFTVKLVVNPKNSATPDEIADIKVWTYSKEVPSQKDIAVFSNKGMSVQPDLLVEGVGNNSYVSNDFSLQMAPNVVYAGVTNTNIVIQLQNDGGSIADYRILSWYSNEGGALTNWIVKYIALPSGIEITSDITNFPNGYLLTNMINGETREIRLKVYARWYGPGTTNSAVGNKLHIFYKFYSVFDPNDPDHRDIGKSEIEIKRGLPDIYIASNENINTNIASGYSTTNFTTTNQGILYVIKGYPFSVLFNLRNAGEYKDIFNFHSVVESNLNRWEFTFTNTKTGDDITSDVTNSGYTFTNIAVNGTKYIKLTVKATNGGVGDRIYFYVYGDTETLRLRRDVCWLIAEISKGLPDIAATNYDTGIKVGWGKDATSESFYDLIEEGETNEYDLYLHNDITGGSNATFVFKQTYKSSDLSVLYFTNGVQIPESSITNGLTFIIPSDSYKVVKVKLNADSATPDTLVNIKWRLTLQNYDYVYDEFEITNKRIELKPDISLQTGSSNVAEGIITNQYIYSGYVDIVAGETNAEATIKLKNSGGSVESFRFTSFWSNIGGEKTNWIVKYIYQSSDITASVTNGGYVFANMFPNDVKHIQMKIYAKWYGTGTTNSAVSNKIRIYYQMSSETRPYRVDKVYLNGEIKRGMPDIYAGEYQKGKNYVSSIASDSNTEVVGIVVGYSGSTYVTYENTGIYEDIFKYYVISSNTGGTWSFQIKDYYYGTDKTSEVTNTNTGIVSTNVPGDLNPPKYQIVIYASNGNVGDALYLDNYLRTETLKERKDLVRVIGRIVDGLPDIACSNYQNNLVTGWGKNATNESAYAIIETGETNTFQIRLHNEAVGGSNALFVFKETGKSAGVNAKYYTNGVEIPYTDITNGVQFRIDSDSWVPIIVKLNQDSISPDSFGIITYKFYLYNYPQVIDTFTITNKKVEYIPDIVLYTNINIGDNIYSTNNYQLQGIKRRVISGVTDESVILKLQNDGGSVESYRLRIWWSNIKGAYTNWIVKITTDSTDITGEVTNTAGKILGPLSSGATTNVYLKVYPKWYGPGTTNSAVGNKLVIFVRWESITRDWHKDVASITNEIIRGIPDLYFADGGIGYDYITNVFDLSNRKTDGAVLDYTTTIVLKIRNTGAYTDIFRYRAVVSNNNNKWQIKFEEQPLTGPPQDITSEVLGSGYVFTNRVTLSAPSYEKEIRISLTPTNGSVGDKVYIYNYVETETLEKREDVGWIECEITEGVPDISVSNILTKVKKGWGKDASDESMFNLIEKNNTNEYYLILRNEITGSVPSDFILKEVSRTAPTNTYVYYATNGVEISSSDMSNGAQFTIYPSSNKQVLLRLALDDYNPDTYFIATYRLYLKNSTNVYDTFTITNKKVEIIPDVAYLATNTTFVGTNIISTNTFEVQIVTQSFIAGVTNTNIKLYLINRGGSVEDFQLYWDITNIGGNKANWDLEIIDPGTSQNIASFGSPYFMGFVPGYSTNIYNLRITPIWYGFYNTNSAVGNSVNIYFRYQSTSLGHRKDMAKITGTIIRGLADAYITNNGITKAKDITTNQFVPEVTTNITLVPYSSDSVYIVLKNTGYYEDYYKFAFYLQEPGTTSWSYSVSNITTGEDITARVINTNIGLHITNNPGESVVIKVSAGADEGQMGDQLVFNGYFRTETYKIREDRVRIVFTYEGGIPDIAVTNYQTAELRGWGRTATNEYCYDRIEKYETNTYDFYLHNEISGTGNADFIFKQDYITTPGTLNLEYSTNGVVIPYTDITNGITISVPAQGYRVLELKVNASNLNSGEKFKTGYKFWYIHNTNVIDTFEISNLRVNPGAGIAFYGTNTNTDVYLLKKYEPEYEYFVKITNKDVVPENFKVTATPSDQYWTYRYYKCETWFTNEITGDITGGWWTGELDTNDYVIIKVHAEQTTNVYPGLNRTNIISVVPSKNENIVSSLSVVLHVVGGVPDIYTITKDGNVVGKGAGAPLSSLIEKIEAGETNIYRIYIRNTQSSNADLTVKEIESYGTNKFYRYYSDSGGDITSTIISTGKNYPNILASQSNEIILKVVPRTNAISGDYCWFKLKVYLTTKSNRYDIIEITNIKVNPQIDLKVAGIDDPYWKYSGYTDDEKVYQTVANVGVSFYVAIINKDNVNENMILQGWSGTNHWSVKYYDANEKDITEQIINGVYTNYNTLAHNTNEFDFISCTVTPTEDVDLSEEVVVWIKGWTEKNPNRMDTVTVRINIKAFIVKGIVINKKTKERIANAQVTAVDAFGKTRKAITDEDGEYTMYITPTYNLKHIVTVEATGYVGEEKTLYPTNTTNELNFELVALNLSENELDERVFPHPIRSGQGATFVYSVPSSGHVTLEIYDIYGRLIKVLVDEKKSKGVYYVKWDGKDENGDVVPRNVYIYVLETPDGVVRRRLFVLGGEE